MRWIVLLATCWVATPVFADTVITTGIPEDKTSDQSVSPCATSANTYTRQACERARQAEKARDKQAQSSTPAEMPLWQQALQPPAPSEEQKGAASPDSAPSPNQSP